MANQPKKYKKFVATAATATLVASAIVPVASAASLSDVAGNTHEAAINALVDAKVINGYADGTFKPNKTLTRSDVVKLLGKYLESQGYEAASDYKTSPRFSDLTSSSNEELLKYAAIVADNGVFSGSNGKLLAGDNITRENMAVVLVRMINTLKGANLEEYVAGQSYTKEVKDLNAAKAEARSAIEVLDFYDITTATTFNPKGSTTRGQFATFLNNTINADFSGASATTGTVKAINNTTVEVTFADVVDNFEALDFTIEGLEVKNAVIKQTDKKTVVLTTAAQEAGKEYTVTVNKNAVGKFVGISAVIPTAIKLTTPSVQGTLGQQVTVKAEVTVATGQSKAGIPVTFNIVSDNANLNEKIEVVSYTNEEGVATYTYTRYYKNNDNVAAYATDKSSVVSTGKVYWAQGLTITEVTSGNTLANGSKKVYKIKTDAYNTQYVGTSTTADYNYVNVAFAENVDVSPDKLVRTALVNDTGVSTNATYPSQVTTGGVQVVRVKVNAAGEATFTVTGSNASVTPVVFVDESTNKVGKLTASALQAAAPTVKFELSHTLGLAVKAEGVQNAAAINASNLNNKGTGEGGRKYTVTITDKDGKIAPAGTKAYVTFAEGSYSTDKNVYIKNGTTLVAANKTTRHEITVTGTKGEATFTLVGNHDAYATPTVYLENGSEAGLDKNDLQTVGEGTYFVDAVIANAALTVLNADGKEVTTLPSSQTAYFEYQSVDQNGFDYFAGTGSYEVSYQVTAQFADVTVSGTFGSKTVKQGTTETVKVNAVNGKAVLTVNSTNVASNVSVQASASLVSLPNQTASIAFTKGTQVPDVYTGNVSSINTVDNKLTFAGFDAITYATASFKNQAGVVISEAQFEKAVADALATTSPSKLDVKVTSVKNADGTYTLEIESITAQAGAGTGLVTSSVLSLDGTQLTVTFDKNVVASSVAATDFTLTSGTVGSVASVSGSTVVLNVSGTITAGTHTLTVVTDGVTFTDGTSNGVLTTLPITQVAGSRVSVLNQTTPSVLTVAQVDAKGSVVVGAKTVNAVVTTGYAKQAAFNGVKVVVTQDGASTSTPTAAYDASTKTITVKLGYVDATAATPPVAVNTLTNINSEIALLADHGDIDFNQLTLTGSDLLFADVATPVTITLASGVTGSTATPGIYTFTINTNLVVGDKVVLNGKTYVAGTDFVVGSTVTATATNLVAAIKAADARFNDAATTNAAGVITLTEATATGLAAPTLSFN